MRFAALTRVARSLLLAVLATLIAGCVPIGVRVQNMFGMLG